VISKNQTINKKFSFENENPDDHPKDFKYLLQIAHEHKLVGIPLSPFYFPENRSLGEEYIRLAFCKKKETLDKSLDIIKKIK